MLDQSCRLLFHAREMRAHSCWQDIGGEYKCVKVRYSGEKLAIQKKVILSENPFTDSSKG